MAWAQPAIVAFEIAMAAHWRAEGLKADFAMGHSVGEFAAALSADTIPLSRSCRWYVGAAR
jgi:acyl transferase domain-containing protein